MPAKAPFAQTNRLGTILELGRLVCSSLDINLVHRHIIDAVRDISGAEVVSIMQIDDQTDQLRIVAAHGIPPALLARVSIPLGVGIAGWVAQHGQPLHLVDPATDPRFQPVLFPNQACLMSLPLRVRDTTRGVLNLARLEQRELFDPEVTQLVEIFADYAAIAIDNAAAAESLRYAASAERLAALSSPISPLADQPPVGLLQFMAELRASMGVGRTAILPDGDEGSVAPLAGWPDDGLLWAAVRASNAEHEQLSHVGSELRCRFALPAGGWAWLAVADNEPGRYWRRAERDLLHYAADRVSALLAGVELISREERSRSLSQTLSQLAAACNAMVGQASLLDFILEQLARFIAYDSCGVFLFHDDQYARMVAGRGFEFGPHTDVVLYMGPGSLTWEIVQDREAVSIADVQQLPGWQNVPDADKVRAWIGVPLIVNDAIIGVLTIDRWVPGGFDQPDVQVARLFADHVAVAIQNQRLLSEARRRANQFEVLQQLSLLMGPIEQPRQMFEEVARLLHTAFGYYQVLIGQVEERQLVLLAAAGEIEQVELFGDHQRYSVDQGLTGWAVRHRETVLANDVRRDPRYLFHPLVARTAAELVVPIGDNGAGLALGMIAIGSTTHGDFSQSDVELVEAVAAQIAAGLAHLERRRELQRAREQLQQNERLRALGELASGIAHDFNNLLSSVLGHTELLLADLDDQTGPVAEGLKIIERAARDGASAVRRLQSFAQLRRPLADDPVQLNDIIAESLALTRPRWRDAAQGHGRPLSIEQDLAELPEIRGDSASLRDAVTNLILNAIDAMPGGGVLGLRSALLPAEASPLGKPSAIVEVHDTGVGIAEELQTHIFEPFFSTKGSGGNGMGLAMVYGVAQRHSGQVSVRSAPGQGSSFQLILPIQPPPQSAPRPALPQPSLPALRLLVVDDEPGVGQILAQYLRRLGHQVEVAVGGRAGISMLEQQRFDLVFSDLGMPEISGWDVAAAARRLSPAPPVVLVTGWGEQIGADQLSRMQVAAIVPKPFDQATLRRVLHEIWNRG